VTKLFAGIALAFSLSGAARAAEKTETLKVNGWHCSGCAARTESALKDVKGVSTAAADKSKKEVTVTYDDTKTNHDALAKAVADSGFSVARSAP